MPISSQRALRAYEAVVVDDIERAEELLNRLPDHVTDSPLISENGTDEYIVTFLRGRWQVR